MQKRTFAVDPDESAKKGDAPSPTAADTVTVDLDGATLVIHAGARAATVALDTPGAPVPPWLRTETPELARPGNVATWAVDRVRNVVGDDAMQVVKAVAFTALDFVLRNKESVTGDTGAEDIAKDLGKTELDPPVRAIPSDPEIGWPPPPLEPWVIPALPGEGQWNGLDRDPFVRKNESLPPAFLTTFIRTDRDRKATRTYVALWDPRQIELHMMAGTVEPKGATGEAGPGFIPRTPEVLKRVVAASNAGFQALHGEFRDDVADGVVLPPAQALRGHGRRAARRVHRVRLVAAGDHHPRDDPLVPPEHDGHGAGREVQPPSSAPGGAALPRRAGPTKTHTVRTGICLTKEHFVAYFYGADLSPDALSQAMISTRCAFGLALDMNAGHSGLEFYEIAPAAELEPLKQALQTDWQHEGEVPGLDGWKFRARRLIRGMGLMHFPRYIKREGRDFFYMTLRHVLPGPALVPVIQKAPLAGEGEWRLKGLPQHGFPYALALTELRADATRPDAKVRVLQIDPRTVLAEPAGKPGAGKTVAVVDAGDKPAGDAPSLWHSADAFSIAPSPPVPEAVRLASGEGPGKAAAAAVGVTDEGGMLFYVEVLGQPSPGDAKVIDQLLKKLGCSTRLSLAQPLPIAMGGDSDLGGTAIRPPSGGGAVRLARAEAAGAKRIFEDTPVVPYETWYPLQQKRIRYFKKPAEAAAADENN